MENFFDEKIRNGNSLNADAIYAIYEKQRRNEVYILLLGILKTRGLFKMAKINIDNMDLSDRQKYDLKVILGLVNFDSYNRSLVLYGEMINILYSSFVDENLFNTLLYNNSLWNENKEEIWQLIKRGKLPISVLPKENSLWEDKKEEIYTAIFGNESKFSEVQKIELLLNLPINHSIWTEKKEEIWQLLLASKNDNFGILPENSVLWNEKESEIWRLVKEGKIKLSIIPKNCILWKRKTSDLWELPDILEYLHFLPKDIPLWEEKKEEIWEFIVSNNESLIDLPITSSLWNEKANDIVQLIFESRPELIAYLLSENVLWRDKKEELWNIIVRKESITYLYPDSELWIEKSDQIIELIKQRPQLLESIRYSSIFWQSEKENIWNAFAENRTALLRYMPKDSPLWEEKKDEIWELAQENFSIINRFPSNYSLLTEKKDEIWEFVKAKKVDLKTFVLNYSNISWVKEKKEEIWEMANSKTNKTFLAQIVDFNDVNEFRRYVDEVLLSEVRNRRRILLRNTVLLNRRSFLEKTNPLSSERLEKELTSLMEFSSIEGYLENIKEILKIIFSRLEDLGVLNKAFDEDKSNNSLGVKECENIEVSSIFERIYNLTDEKEIIYYTLFYINKLTKLNNITMYLNAMKKDFIYDKEKDIHIDTINKLAKLRECFCELKDRSMPGQFFSYVFKIIDDENVDFSNIKNKEFRELLEEIKAMRSTLIDIRTTYGDGLLRSLKIISVHELNTYYEQRKNAEKISTQIVQESRKLRKNYVGNFEEDLQNLDLDDSENEISKKIKELSEIYDYDINDIYDSFIYAEYAIVMQDRLYKIKGMLLERYIALNKEKVKAYKYQNEGESVLETVTNEEIFEEGSIPYDRNFDINSVLTFLEENGIDIKDVTIDTFLTFLNPLTCDEPKKIFTNWHIYIINEVCVKNKRPNEVSEEDFAVFKNPKAEYNLWRSKVWFKGKISDDFEIQLLKKAYMTLEEIDLYKDFEAGFNKVKMKLIKLLDSKFVLNGTLENIDEIVEEMRNTLKCDRGLENIKKKDVFIDVLVDSWKSLYNQTFLQEQENVAVTTGGPGIEQHQDILFIYNNTDILPNAYHCKGDNIKGFDDCLPESEIASELERKFFNKVSRQIAFPFTREEIGKIKTSFAGIQDTPYYWIIHPGRALAQASRGLNGTGILTIENITNAASVIINDLRNMESSLEFNGEEYDE